MALTAAYLIAKSRLEEFLSTIRNAQAPEKFTVSFLKDLGFTSSNERLFLPMLKGLGFLDEAGAPTQRYFDFLDDSRWQLVLADGIREAYEDLFRLNRKAHEMERSDVIGKLKSLTRGQYSEAVIGNMAMTFEALCELANFEQDEMPSPLSPSQPPDANDAASPSEQPLAPSIESPTPTAPPAEISGLVYRIEIVLPVSRDKAVYDALFRSLREHLR
jgi:hypothetical protein